MGLSLPTPGQPLVGREDELHQLESWLGEPGLRLITLVGVGGIGKTRLALEVAQRSSLPVIWVALEDVESSPEAILNRLGQTLELPECARREWHERLDTVLARPTLVVLDNLEQLRDEAGQIAELLAKHSQLRVLATSRAPLLLADEQLLTLEPLDTPMAVSLLVERARSVRPDFEVSDENRELIEELCARLDGIPLCLELAAARLRHLGLVELNASLKDNIEMLSGGGPDRPRRQQTLSNTLDWSFSLLEGDQQSLFLKMGVFRAGFDREAVTALSSETSSIPTALLALADHSLVATRHTATGETRYALLETVRHYALKGLEAKGALEEARLAHANHYLTLARRLSRCRGTEQHAAGLKTLALEKGNLAQALETFKELGRWREGLKLAGALGWYWEACSLLAEGRQSLEALLARYDEREGEAAQAHHFLAVLACHQGDYEVADRHFTKALESWSDQANRSESLCGMGQLRFRQGEYRLADELYHDALKCARQAGHRQGEVEALNGMGRVAWVLGEVEQGIDYEKESLRLAQGHPYPLGEGWAHNALGEIYRNQKNRRAAARHFRAAAESFRGLHEFSLAALALQNLAYVELGQGRWEEAGSGFREALSLWRQAGARHGLALCLIGLAGVLAGLSRHYLGAQFLGAAERLLASVDVHLEKSDRQDRSDILARLRSALGDQFAQATFEGDQTSVDELLSRLDRNEEPPEGLTAREFEVLKVTATGASNKEIAEALCISPQTVMVHLRSIYRKLGVSSRTAAARWAAENGVLT